MQGALPVKAPPLSSAALGANPARLRHEMAGTGFEIEEETRRFLLGGKAGSGPPTRTSGNGVLPGATVTTSTARAYTNSLCASFNRRQGPRSVG
jgi:hypothetical protein